MSVRAALLLLFVLGACGEGRAPPGAERAAAPFELRAVAAAELARLPALPEPPALAGEPLAELFGLVSMVAGSPDLLEVAREDVARLGPGCFAALAECARDPGKSDAERSAALDLLPAADPGGARVLLGLVQAAEPPWVRARAAWRLASGAPDLVVPGLVLCLRYEKHHETVVLVAAALARQANFAGLDGLIAIAAAADSPARASAEAELARLSGEYAFASADELWRAWRQGDPEGRLPAPERSALYLREVWTWIDRLREFQLRGVDDARFLLERLDGAAARALALALHEEDVYVRVHSAQCLERMGPRGLPAAEDLLAGLTEPELAPHAAAALGALRAPEALGPLLSLAKARGEPGLWLASVRALGFLGDPEALGVLAALADEPDAELAQAALESTVRIDAGALGAARRLADFLEDPRVDPATSERALREWFYQRGATPELLRWDALAPDPSVPETAARTRERRAERAALVRGLAG
jgi:hypothetical protein